GAIWITAVQHAAGIRHFSWRKTLWKIFRAETRLDFGSRALSLQTFHLGYWRAGYSSSRAKPPARAIRHVRDWLQSAPGKAAIPGGMKIWEDYRRFRRELPAIAEEAQLDPRQLTFIDYLLLASNWLQEHR